jgi:serine protease Do
MKTRALQRGNFAGRLAAMASGGATLVVTFVVFSSASARTTAPAVEPPPAVVDDTEMEEKFVRGLLTDREVESFSVGREVTEAVRAAQGRRAKAALPSRHDSGHSHEAWRNAVVVIGSISKCEECPEWHMDSVSAGWFLTPDGLVATNFHVLEDEGAEQLGVMTADGRVFRIKEVVAADRDGDAALLRIDADGAEWAWLPLASGVAPGEEAGILSHPDGRFYSLSKGIVSRLHRAPADDEGEPRVWTTVTADFGAGSSGAPVLNGRGEVIGMVSSTAVLLADPEEGKDPAAEDVQMVFKDCVSLETMRGLLE